MIDFNKRAFWHFTLKDILTIISSVAIPIALAIYSAIGSQQQKREAEKTRQFDLEQAEKLRQRTLYDEFLNNIYKLDKDDYLSDTKNPWAFANAYYRAAHRQWDTIRKADVLQFLKEKQLIGRNNCSNGCRTTNLNDIIRLNKLNFDNVHLASETGVLNQLDLECVSFDQVSMSNAVFSFASLNGVSFDGGRLDKVKFDDSSLLCASFNGVNLSGVDFGNSDLAGAHFSNTDLSGAKITEDQIKQAYFHNVTMPNGVKRETISSTTTKKPIIQTTTTTIKTKMSTTTSSSTTTTTMMTTTTSTKTSTTTTTSASTSTTTSTSTTSTTTLTTTTTTTTSSIIDYVFTPSPASCNNILTTSCTTTTTIIASCQSYEVSWNNHCYYLDGSSGSCIAGYSRATSAVLPCISSQFVGKTYRSTISDNCCVWTAATYVCFGLNSNCNSAEPFTSGPALGGGGGGSDLKAQECGSKREKSRGSARVRLEICATDQVCKMACEQDITCWVWSFSLSLKKS
ncbi:unnamed protein product [Adineta steineri]|uniref:Pentapeptide repeat-containing protein n=1 Tax=Adineta steineri TaxID=433720 RepID=A0A813SL23_9BILA|nr:unnamed protein product [Adineta steineri]CAF1463153.1 unnamed protein product [Adineta steineri]